jgi:hypothetical protein
MKLWEIPGVQDGRKITSRDLRSIVWVQYQGNGTWLDDDGDDASEFVSSVLFHENWEPYEEPHVGRDNTKANIQGLIRNQDNFNARLCDLEEKVTRLWSNQ